MLKSFIPSEKYVEEFKLVIIAILIPYFSAFYELSKSTKTTISEAAEAFCWPYLINCSDFFFLEAIPFGYSHNIFYAGIFLVFLITVYGLIKNNWRLVWWMLLLLFVWKLFTSFVIGATPGNYEYYDIILLFILLFLPYKDWFLRLGFVFLYFLASTIKIHEGWVLGTYFTSLDLGLAVFGNTLAPILTLLITIMQIVGAWFLLSKRESIQVPVFFFFFAFHLYSAVYVGWRYPISDIFMLSVLFYLYKDYEPVGINRRSIGAYVFLVFLLFMQFIPKLIPGDQKLTLEGNNLGLYMFEANHQCLSTVMVGDGQKIVFSPQAQHRCNPALYLQKIQKYCKEYPTVPWTFDNSINGGPFYRIVDVPDVCTLQYSMLKRNDWIKSEMEEPEVVAFPLKNYY